MMLTECGFDSVKILHQLHQGSSVDREFFGTGTVKNGTSVVPDASSGPRHLLSK